MEIAFDWRIGLLVVADTGIYLLITSAMEEKSAAIAPKRQESAAKLVSAVLEQVQGTMSLADALMTVIISFLVFAQIESAGSGMVMLCLVGVSIDHANRMDEIPQMDEGGRDITPKKHDIVFENVRFS